MLHALQLADGRGITIYLPPRYDDEPERRYPVLYLQDGQNLFDPAKAFSGVHWRVAETATGLIDAGRLSPLIVVGIDNTGVNRLDEYTPTHDRKRGGGDADRYAALLVNQVKPLVDGTYRTLVDSAYTGIGGSSLGGLVSLYLVLTAADTFGRAAVLSPSVWWDRRSILKPVRRARALARKPRLWVDVGTRESSGEGSARRVVEDVRLLRAGLVSSGWVEGVDLHYEELHGAGHHEGAWAERFGRVLEWLYADVR